MDPYGDNQTINELAEPGFLKHYGEFGWKFCSFVAQAAHAPEYKSLTWEQARAVQQRPDARKQSPESNSRWNCS